MPSTIIPCLRYRDAHAAIAFLEAALGFTRKAVYDGPDNTVAHAELTLDGGMIMIGSYSNQGDFAHLSRQPDEIGLAETQTPYVVVKTPPPCTIRPSPPEPPSSSLSSRCPTAEPPSPSPIPKATAGRSANTTPGYPPPSPARLPSPPETRVPHLRRQPHRRLRWETHTARPPPAPLPLPSPLPLPLQLPLPLHLHLQLQLQLQLPL
jgi:hypothetical protein